VREGTLEASIRTGPLRPPAVEEPVGYAVPKKSARGVQEVGFIRRIFTLKPCDRYHDLLGKYREALPSMLLGKYREALPSMLSIP
jgi:hypothetical protein